MRCALFLARLEGWPRALVADPSRLAVKNGEHLRMTKCRVAISYFSVTVSASENSSSVRSSRSGVTET